MWTREQYDINALLESPWISLEKEVPARPIIASLGTIRLHKTAQNSFFILSPYYRLLFALSAHKHRFFFFRNEYTTQNLSIFSRNHSYLLIILSGLQTHSNWSYSQLHSANIWTSDAFSLSLGCCCGRDPKRNNFGLCITPLCSDAWLFMEIHI